MSSSSSSSATPSVKIEQKSAWWKSFVAGNVGGIFGLSLAYPLDTVKIRLQTRDASAYRGTLHCFQSMVRKEGVTSLYRGLLAPVIGYGMINAVAFGSYNQAKEVLQSETIQSKVLAGSFAGFTSSFVRAPIEQIKTVMQARNLPGSTKAAYSGSLACIVDVVKTEGVIQGLFRGLPPTIVREMAQYAVYYPAYEVTKLSLAGGDKDNLKTMHPAKMALAGGIAGVAQWIPTYWTDVVKSRMHNAEPGQYKSMIHCSKLLYAEHGIGVFFRGINVSLIRAFPLHGAIFVGYDMCMRALEPY